MLQYSSDSSIPLGAMAALSGLNRLKKEYANFIGKSARFGKICRRSEGLDLIAIYIIHVKMCKRMQPNEQKLMSPC